MYYRWSLFHTMGATPLIGHALVDMNEWAVELTSLYGLTNKQDAETTNQHACRR